MEDRSSIIRDLIDTLRRQRVRQGEVKRALDCIILQAGAAATLDPAMPLAKTARQIKARAVELHRIHNSVPRFVVEDLLEEAVADLQRAQREALQP